ncbi:MULTISPECIES: glycosyltransferase [unclassified Paracoccus (in: a-proteobacteria)]|uniref:glycosyltransferase n=1 Tax=unclassified Paracoccus (in: a-proteobacteria) TaxID=2688777 RepID=UPI0012B3DF2E|nr:MULTISPECIES: glycosyltransferase [unclassified Paracoccus (in: a-proteobacteria)]UXU76064.1 putative rhamnosyl transferase [Paracoccus sp. SMMA_5]UXU81976.1 putative rhamnosyl transferase [Paracoccus sp. SMMA_5_TC]
MRVQMLGLCRFSYLGERGFQTRHRSLQDRRAFLYDPQRLARRWHWFERVTLPALLAQTEPDFTLVLMTGPDLPEPYLSRLRELESLAPQFRLALVPPMPFHLRACLRAIAPHIDARADVVGHFRQDDDDAVAVDYIQRSRADFADLQGLWKREGRLFCDHARGLVLHAKARPVTLEQRVIHAASAALTVFLPPDAGQSVLHFPHWQIACHMPGVTFADRLMFLRVLNQDNDSGAVGAGYGLAMPDVDWRAILARRFRIDLSGLSDPVAH